MKQKVHALKRENKLLVESRRNLHTMLEESKRLLDVSSGDLQNSPDALFPNRSPPRPEVSPLVESKDEDLPSEEYDEILVEERENTWEELNVSSSPAVVRNDTSSSIDLEDVFDLDAGAGAGGDNASEGTVDG